MLMVCSYMPEVCLKWQTSACVTLLWGGTQSCYLSPSSKKSVQAHAEPLQLYAVALKMLGIRHLLLCRVSIKKRFIVATSMMLVILIITTAFVKVPTKNCKCGSHFVCSYSSTPPFLPRVGVRGFFPFTLISLFCLNGTSVQSL